MFKIDSFDWNPRTLAPIHFDAWTRAFAALVQEIDAGPGLVCLVGPGGGGKSYLLSHYSKSAGDRQVALRSPDDELDADVAIDLVDDVLPGQAASLARSLPPGVTRVLSLRPDALAALPGKASATRTITIAPMYEADVRTMIAARCRQAGAPPGIFSDDAVALLVQLAGSVPRQVDKLVRDALQQALNQAQTDAIGNWMRRPGELTCSPPLHDLAPAAVMLETTVTRRSKRTPDSPYTASGPGMAPKERGPASPNVYLPGGTKQANGAVQRSKPIPVPRLDPAVTAQPSLPEPPRRFKFWAVTSTSFILASVVAGVLFTPSARLSGLVNAIMPSPGQHAATSLATDMSANEPSALSEASIAPTGLGSPSTVPTVLAPASPEAPSTIMLPDILPPLAQVTPNAEPQAAVPESLEPTQAEGSQAEFSSRSDLTETVRPTAAPPAPVSHVNQEQVSTTPIPLASLSAASATVPLVVPELPSLAVSPEVSPTVAQVTPPAKPPETVGSEFVIRSDTVNTLAVTTARTVPVSQVNQAQALRLLNLAKTMLSVGQIHDAAEMFHAAAVLGNKEAKARDEALSSPR